MSSPLIVSASRPLQTCLKDQTCTGYRCSPMNYHAHSLASTGWLSKFCGFMGYCVHEWVMKRQRSDCAGRQASKRLKPAECQAAMCKQPTTSIVNIHTLQVFLWQNNYTYFILENLQAWSMHLRMYMYILKLQIHNLIMDLVLTNS